MNEPRDRFLVWIMSEHTLYEYQSTFEPTILFNYFLEAIFNFTNRPKRIIKKLQGPSKILSELSIWVLFGCNANNTIKAESR